MARRLDDEPNWNFAPNLMGVQYPGHRFQRMADNAKAKQIYRKVTYEFNRALRMGYWSTLNDYRLRDKKKDIAWDSLRSFGVTNRKLGSYRAEYIRQTLFNRIDRLG